MATVIVPRFAETPHPADEILISESWGQCSTVPARAAIGRTVLLRANGLPVPGLSVGQIGEGYQLLFVLIPKRKPSALQAVPHIQRRDMT